MTKMYSERTCNIPAYRGCQYQCKYCAFRSTLRRSPCEKCRNYEPHAHLEALQKKPPRTEKGRFITIGLTGDISWATGDVINQIIKYCEKWRDRTFLIQSKNPARLLDFDFPYNVMLGTTIETNLTTIWQTSYSWISKAPAPFDRYLAMRRIRNNDTIITIEPILDFHTDSFTSWMRNLQPKVVYIGYDSKPELSHLPEPPLAKTQELIEQLETITEVRQKLIRTAWWEQA